ncbi:hypothetical protein [Pseudofrankia sp. BMG5.36]|uniref:hypothetical protein n=1 Tax=Pseudofrankia sp. BMG5.36 TaxID=1834512 RepID=UPI00104205E0|nr:hypothetical protein [Pseudofrankia sp. BMG5.36]
MFDWDREQLWRLRAPGVDVAAALAGRPIAAVAEHVGQLLLDVIAGAGAGAGAARIGGKEADALAEQARRCVAELWGRGWEGDDVLARELADVLGEPWPPETAADAPMSSVPDLPRWPLTPIPVHLADLAEFLDGDPRQGRGVIDLETGFIWPPGSLEFDPPPELNELRDDFDPERWLAFSPESGEGYRDMLDFADTVDARWRERLLRALDGRGPFRRFRDALVDAPNGYRSRWEVFGTERALGRARVFLADNGYRATGHGWTPAV